VRRGPVLFVTRDFERKEERGGAAKGEPSSEHSSKMVDANGDLSTGRCGTIACRGHLLAVQKHRARASSRGWVLPISLNLNFGGSICLH